MKNKEFDTVQTFRSIRNNNYEKTKNMTPQELIEWYKKRGDDAKKQFKETANDSKVSG